VEVPAERLDAFDLRSVGFIKIDVEGHKVSVLEGARETIRRERPNLVVEATDLFRPDSIADCRAFFESLDYGGYFLMEGRLLPIDRFLPSYQDPSQREPGAPQGIRLRNFIFVPHEQRDLLRAIDRLANSQATPFRPISTRDVAAREDGGELPSWPTGGCDAFPARATDDAVSGPAT